jgi:hypothetical protein
LEFDREIKIKGLASIRTFSDNQAAKNPLERMKQCPRCNRTYADDTLAYCLEDGSGLVSQRDLQETLRIPPAPVTDWPVSPAPTPAPPYQTNNTRSRWPIYALGGFALLVLLAGAAGILIFSYSRMTASTLASSDDQRDETKGESSPTANSSPSPSPTPRSSAALVGAWRTRVVENGQAQEITVTFLADGNTRYLFKDARGRTANDQGAWQYSDGVLFERFSTGASGKASIKWIDDNTVELTIIENGVPSYIGVKRLYRRVT